MTVLWAAILFKLIDYLHQELLLRGGASGIPDIYHARLTDDDMEDSIQWLNPENDSDELPEKFIPPASA